MWVGTVDAGAFTMDCCRFGQGRETLVILPGISLQRVMGTAGAIAGAYRKLAESCEICVFERRNDMPPGYGVRDMALDTARAMEALGLGPAHLFGASQGGMMAMALAALRPELVKRLILGSTSARISDERYGAVFEPWARLARAGDAAALCRTFAEAVYPRRGFGKLGPLLSELAGALALGRKPGTLGVRDETLATMACKAAVKAGKDSDPREWIPVVEAVLRGEVKYCPHGRPVTMRLTKKQLDRNFRRT